MTTQFPENAFTPGREHDPNPRPQNTSAKDGTWRQLAVRVFFASVVGAQAYAVVHAYHDPLKRFGYQPFAESSVWHAQIFAVDRAGHKRDVQDGFEGYRWSQLVRERVGNPFRQQSASSGVGATLYFLQRALDYVADHTPNDQRTLYLEADVFYRQNRRPEATTTLRSKLRDIP